MPYKSKVHRARRRATIKRANAEAMQIKGLPEGRKGDFKDSGCRGYTKQGPNER